MEIVFVYMTTSSDQEAKMIGKQLVEKRLAACVNILPQMESFYWWEGKVDNSNECVLIAKTTKARVQSLTAVVKALHSYDCPCVVTLPIDQGNPDYMNWLKENVS